MVKFKKVTSVILSVIMLVCMFTIPAYASSVHLDGKTDLVKICVEKKSNVINVYFDGANSDKFKAFVTEKIKEMKNKYNIGTPSTYIRCDDGDIRLWVNYKIDSNNKIFDVSYEWYYNGWNPSNGFKYSEYKINKNGLTSGYMVSITDSDVISNFSFFENESKFTLDADFINDDGWVDYTFPLDVIKLSSSSSATAKTKLSISAKKDTLTLKWDKVSGAEKYEVAYSTDNGKTYKIYKSCKSTVTKTTFKATKGKTYKFKVRSTKTENGKTVYSKWSNVIKVKT